MSSRPFEPPPFGRALVSEAETLFRRIGPSPRRPGRELAPRWWRAGVLLLLTFGCSTILGPAWYLGGFDSSLLPLLTPSTIRAVIDDPELLRWGLQFAMSLLIILGSHELGHSLACRRHGIAATLPYFLPAPIGLGTFGAFIRVRGPIETRRQLFDVGVMGPIAGFMALLPFLVYGIAHSIPVAAETLDPPDMLVLPGSSLALLIVVRLFHGDLGSNVLVFHPFALAAWAGMLITALNLLPMAQLDGGHIFYAAHPGRQRRWAWLLWFALVVAGAVFWFGWWLWAVIVLVMGPRHPRVWSEAQGLDGARKLGALGALVLFVLCFMPVPVVLLH